MAISRTDGLFTGQAHIGGAAQIQSVLAIQHHQQLVQHAAALRLGLSMGMKRLGHGLVVGSTCRCFGLAWWFVNAAHQGLQQLSRILKITLPQQACALTSQTVSGVCAHAVVGQHHPLGRFQAIVSMPQRLLCLGLRRPMQVCVADRVQTESMQKVMRLLFTKV